jgi:hypothetical protein
MQQERCRSPITLEPPHGETNREHAEHECGEASLCGLCVSLSNCSAPFAHG